MLTPAELPKEEPQMDSTTDKDSIQLVLEKGKKNVNIVCIGNTGGGKSTFLNSLMKAINPDEFDAKDSFVESGGPKPCT